MRPGGRAVCREWAVGHYREEMCLSGAFGHWVLVLCALTLVTCRLSILLGGCLDRRGLFVPAWASATGGHWMPEAVCLHRAAEPA